METQRRNETASADAGGIVEDLGLKAEAQESRTPFLLPIVFVSGMAVMATEMCASRLIQPYFGDSLLIWANLIGFIMIYLTAGYFLGGRLADRFPRPTVLYQLTALAGFIIGLIPVLSSPILTLSNEGFRNVDGGLFFGSLVGIILLFSLPLILLGCVSPFAVRLRVKGVSNAGKVAGSVSSLSTVGSILGTFLPVLVIIPWVGTRATLYIFAATLLAFSLLGLYLSRSKRLPFYAPLLLVVLLLGFLMTTNIIKPPTDGQLLAQKESSFNYIQVVRPNYNPDQLNLVLNEGHAIHSIYNPKQVLTGGYWDYYMIAPFFNKGMQEQNVKSAYIVGLAAGTVPRIMTAGYGDGLKIEGAELDPAILEVGRKYFHMDEQKNLKAVAQDGRYYLLASQQKYDIIAVDAFRQPYIPFHLTTQEFYKLSYDHLSEDGVLVANIGSPAAADGKRDYRLVEALASTMRSVFPSVQIIDVNGTFNTVVVATRQPTDLADFQENVARLQNPLLRQVGQTAAQTGNIRPWNEIRTVFTDDWAPVERVIDQVIIDYVVGGGK